MAADLVKPCYENPPPVFAPPDRDEFTHALSVINGESGTLPVYHENPQKTGKIALDIERVFVL